MLLIKNKVIKYLTAVFTGSATEQFLLLGCSEELSQIDSVCLINCIQSEKNFCIPDFDEINFNIKNWAKAGICFCGFIHSHICKKDDLSQADILFAENAFRSFNLPQIWMGLASVSKDSINYKFFVTCKKLEKEQITTEPVAFKVLEE